MPSLTDESRRRLLKRLTLGVALTPIAATLWREALAADGPLVTRTIRPPRRSSM